VPLTVRGLGLLVLCRGCGATGEGSWFRATLGWQYGPLGE
jgi:hypothetical protein